MWPPLELAHVIPVGHSREADPGITLALLGLGVFAMAVTGLLATRAATTTVHRQHVGSALALGALLFLLFDLLKESASLGQGLTAEPLLQAALVAAFAGGLLAFSSGGGTIAHRRLAWAWTLGIAAHTMGEAWIVGTDAYSTTFFEPTQSASFLLHKLIEAATIPLVSSAVPPPRVAIKMGAALAGAALAGGIGGFYWGPTDAPLLLFAAGAGATSWAIVLLARRAPPHAASAAWVAVGVAVVYAAGLLHQY